jgi:hypothetical protein
MANFFIFIFATAQTLIFGWVLGPERAYREMMDGSAIRLPRWILPVIRYVSPLYLLVIFALWLRYSLPERWQAIRNPPPGEPPVVLMSIGFILLVMIFFSLVISGANQRWDAAQNQEET